MSRHIVSILLAVLMCVPLGRAGEAALNEILARLKAVEEKNKELEAKLKRAETRASTDAAIDKAIATSDEKLGKVLTAPDPHNRPLTIGGYLDISYQYNLNRPDNQRNNLRVFDTDSNGFNVHLAEINVSRLPVEPGQAGFRIDFDFGTDQRFFAAQDAWADPSSRMAQFKDVDIQQAYISYIAPIGNGITIDAGKFVTGHGAEVIEASDNINASRSLLFGYAIPFTHTGIRSYYDVFTGTENGGKWTVSAGVVNGWDNIQDQNDAKTFMLASNWQATKWFNWTLNAMYGDEQFTDERARFAAATGPGGDFEGTFDDPTAPGFGAATTGKLWDSHNSGGRVQVDTVMTFTPWDKWTFVLNADYGHEGKVPQFNGPRNRTWYGLAAYIKYQFHKDWYIANRTEYFNDREGARTGRNQTLWETTVTVDWALSDPMHLRFEYRHDESNVDSFANSKGVGDGGVNMFKPFRSDSQDTLMLQWLYKF
jgi:hypothetical protein